MKNTDIEWCDSTVNPVMGCEGCELWTKATRICYAGLLHEAQSGAVGFARKFENPEVFPDRMAKAASWKSLLGEIRTGRKSAQDKPWLTACPRTIFVGDMGDLFSSSVKDQFIADTFEQAHKAPQHIWIFLTKRPSRMAKVTLLAKTPGGAVGAMELPRNIWMMTSVTSVASLARIPFLKETDAWVKGLSIEPLVEDLPGIGAHLNGIDWVVVGGTSGMNVPRTEIGWIQRVVDECLSRNIPVFVKQIGSGHQLVGDIKGGNPKNWPESLRIRQMPLQKITLPGDWNYHPTKFYAYKADMFDESSPNVLKSGTSIPNR